MRKKIFNGEDEISGLVSTVENYKTIMYYYGLSVEKIKTIIANPLKEITSELVIDGTYSERINVANDIAILSMAIAVKTMIPRENYKDIVLKIIPGRLEEHDERRTLGTCHGEQEKIVASMYADAINALAFGEIDSFCISLGVFAHELCHVVQRLNSRKKDSLTISNLIYCLENLAYFDDYSENYDNIFFETEAFYEGNNFSANFLSVFLNKKGIQGKYIDIMMKNRPNWKNDLNDFDTQCDIVKRLLEIIKRKKIKITEENLNKYPILNAVFDSNGNFYDKQKYNQILLKRLSDETAGEKEHNFCKLLLNVTQDSQIEKPPRVK